MLEKLELNECLSFSFVYESMTRKIKELEGKFLDEVIEYSLDEEGKQTLEKAFNEMGGDKLINQDNRILVSNFLYLILEKIHIEEDITPLEFDLCQKIFGFGIDYMINCNHSIVS